ncbi:MAG: serine/threonine-protein kinase, partial [Myxococcota bacterium]
MHPAPELPRNLAGRRLGRYEVLTQLASGGMAAVYIARAVGVAGFERLVAIKVLHPHLAYEEEFISMFLDEARVAASIRHPNVVPTLDISDTEGDGFFLVMEYIEGDHFGSLLGEAARGGERVSAPVSIRILLDALGGLAAAHRLCDEYGERLNLVHRDVSPHNILVGTDGIARLTDFGVAKAEKRLTSTRAGQLKGKLAYMSPEQASTGAVDQRSDLFSMGVIVWEALTGRRLFRAENNGATLNKILHEPIPLPSELWDDLGAYDEVMAKALDRDPDARFQTAEDFAAALEDAADAHAGVARARQVESSVRTWLGERVD